jgi:hypothetical protein
MSEGVRNYILAAVVALLVTGVGWYGWKRIYGRYHQTEPPSKEKPMPRVERPLEARLACQGLRLTVG